jgi:hypothetical protein
MRKFRQTMGVALLLVAVGCEYNLGPTVNVSNTNTNTNTNTNNTDLHDLITFAAATNPTAPIPIPGGGTETPLPLPIGAQGTAQTYANNNPTLLARSCQALYGESAWAFLDGLVRTLAATDPRWGYVVKSNTGTISQDVIAYRATSATRGVWAIDVIVDHCGATPPVFAWNVLGLDANLQWSGTRF